MTKLIAILIITFFLSWGLTISQTSKKAGYKLKIEKGGFIKVDRQTFWIIPTTLTNLTTDTLKYFSMSCAWQVFYSVDNKNLQIVEPSKCFKNGPIILTLPPSQSRKVKIKLLISQTMDASVVSFRIGFNLMQAKNNLVKFDFEEQTKKKNVIWSNLISM